MSMDLKDGGLYEDLAKTRCISIQMIIDVDAVIRNHPIPGTEPEKPVEIESGYGYMVVSNARACRGQGTDNIKIKANVGDKICIHAVSSSNNFDNCVLLYKIDRYSGKDCLKKFRSCDYYRRTAVPGSLEEVLPEKLEDVHFGFQEAEICRMGNEACKVNLAIYIRDAQGNSKIFGYFSMRFNLKVWKG